MNRERLKKLLPVMQAYLAGEQIQSRDANVCSDWRDCFTPLWSGNVEYRIKPKSTYRPYTYEEAVQHLLGRMVKHKRKSIAMLVHRVSSPNDVVWCSGIIAESLLNDYTFFDGTPCGMLDE